MRQSTRIALENSPKVSVLFVCMGNICRSPTAEGVLRKLLDESGFSRLVRIDSAGTHAYHLDEPPDIRAQQAALERGIDISMLRARLFEAQDFENFDHILVMDRHNFDVLKAMCPKSFEHKVDLLLNYAPHLSFRDVPDPYYGGDYGFERVLDLLEDACAGLLESLKQTNF
ncbi:MAG: low molecular weight protein-tyrosine-phosphatase [Gammaproteobacteria bacterium]